MWVLVSFSNVVVAGPFKSEAEMARKLGVSQQYVNRKICKSDILFHLDGQKVNARRVPGFLAGTKRFLDKEDIGKFLGVPQEVIDKVFRKNTSGFVQTPQGKVKIQKLIPGKKPTLPTQKNKILFLLLMQRENSKSTPKPSQVPSKLGETLSPGNQMGKHSRLKFRRKTLPRGKSQNRPAKNKKQNGQR